VEVEVEDGMGGGHAEGGAEVFGQLFPSTAAQPLQQMTTPQFLTREFAGGATIR
jgi:hypothetical protein